MKAIITLGTLLTVASIVCGCNKVVHDYPAASNPPPVMESERPPLIVLEKSPAAPAAPVAPVAPVAPIAVQPSVPTAPPTPAATPPSPFAPDGVFFLTHKVSRETDSGIISAPPGARVEKQANGTFKTANGDLFKLKPSDITNDTRIAAQLAGHDARIQAAARSASPATSESVQQMEMPAQVPRTASSAQPAAGLNKPAGPAPATSLGASSLNSGAYGKKRAFIDHDGDGRAFEIRSGASRNFYDRGN